MPEAVVVVIIIICFCLRMMRAAGDNRPEHLRQPVEQGRSRTTRTAPPGNGNENRPAILVRSRSGNRAAILVPTSRHGASSARAPAREPLDSKAMFELQQRAKQDPMVNPLGHHPADYTPPELMLSAPPPRAKAVPSESAVQATSLNSIKDTYVRLYGRQPQDDKLDDGPWLLKKIKMHSDSTDEECAVIREWLRRMQAV